MSASFDSPWAVAKQAAEHAREGREVASRARESFSKLRALQRAYELDNASAQIELQGKQVAYLLAQLREAPLRGDDASRPACIAFLEAAHADLKALYIELRAELRGLLVEFIA